MMEKTVLGFSKMDKDAKINWLISRFLDNNIEYKKTLNESLLLDFEKQKIINGFSENTISNFILPYGLSPNFLIDGQVFCVPMVIEESSVVAAASAAAKYWMDRGGFKTTILGTQKVGQVHFKWYGPADQIKELFPVIEMALRRESEPLTKNMVQRGGGITKIELLDFNQEEKNLYQIKAHFETCNSMGANFINSVLENFANTLEKYIIDSNDISDDHRDIDIVMSILSNHTPECVVRAEVSCPVEDLGTFANGMMAERLAEKFRLAVKIAGFDPHRATTHNKGIFNGIDAVIIATGNDFRAIEAAGHTYAARTGQYRSLSFCEINDGIFKFWLDVPLAIGTVGGLTSLHPLSKLSLDILGQPSAEQLMRIIASVGLAQNFAAVRSLVTTGIQQGHMKMHIMNILNHLSANDIEIAQTLDEFNNKTISFAAVRDFIEKLRQ